MQKRNYSIELERLIARIKREGTTPSLLLHACCAPCSSYVLEYLSEYFKITVFYYNPNIAPTEEYEHRVAEIERFVKEFPAKNPITLIKGKYDPERYYAAVRGLEREPEGGARCKVCFELRLAEAADLAKELGADYFTTTLTISPMKNAPLLNEIGEQESARTGIKHLPSDFKKKGGFKRSTELSAEYNLYRQDFCGCVYSQKEAEERRKRLAEKQLLES